MLHHKLDWFLNEEICFDVDCARALDVSEVGAIKVNLQRLLTELVGNQRELDNGAVVGLQVRESVWETLKCMRD